MADKELARLRNKQKDQIEKLKKLSNYDKITEMLERHGQLPPRAPQNPFGTPQAGNRSRPATPQGTPSPVQGQPGHLTPAQQAIMARTLQQQQRQGAAKRSFPPPPPGFARPGLALTPIRGQPGSGLNVHVPADQFGGGEHSRYSTEATARLTIGRSSLSAKGTDRQAGRCLAWRRYRRKPCKQVRLDLPKLFCA